MGNATNDGNNLGPTMRLVAIVLVFCGVLVAFGLYLNHVQSAPHQQFALTIETPDQLNNEPIGPAYIPGAFTLPANATVTVTVTDFDDATALPAQYASATGIKGPMRIQALNAEHPNGYGPTNSATVLNAQTGVGHTFTITAIGLNVPIAPHARTTFTFHTPKRGTYSWRCMDPCGPGPAGWGGAMATNGWMQGTVTFT